MPVPSMRKSLTREKDTANLQALLSAPVTCTLPLAELLKLKPNLWMNVAACLTEHGVWAPGYSLTDLLKAKPQERKPYKPVPIRVNKVGKHTEDDKGNTTLPIEINKVISTAILNSGAGVSIATKAIWKLWGKPTIRRTRMSFQLADGSLETPMGLLENFLVKSCGIEFEHTFAVIHFGQETNYKVILGRPFMR